MLHLRAMLDNCGGEFANLQELNKNEQNLVAGAKSKMEVVADLTEANAMSNAWTLLWHEDQPGERTDQGPEAAEQGVKKAEQDANRMYRERLKNADIGESLNRIMSEVQGLNGVVEEI